MSKKIIKNEQIIEAIKNSNTIKDTLEKLNMAPSGGNYQTIRRCISNCNVDISHFTKPGFKKGCTSINEMSDEQIFTTNSNYNKFRLKNRIIQKSILPYECTRCGIVEWQGEKLSLHLDHINGIRNDNRIENLRFLCPNCHSLTETYCSKANKLPQKFCCDCGIKLLYSSSKRCHKCSTENRVGKKFKIIWPPIENLLQIIEQSSYVSVGKQLGVSDNAIRKHIKKHNK